MAQPSLSVFDLDVSAFPNVKAKFVAMDANGEMIRDLSVSDFAVQENGASRPVISITCPPETPPRSIWSVLALDVSLSMQQSSLGSGRTRLDLVKEAAHLWIDKMDVSQSACAITAFDHEARIVASFTDNKAELHDSIETLFPNGQTDYEKAFLDRIAGGIPVAKRGFGKRVLVLLTDGVGTGNRDKIIEAARTEGVEIYCIAFEMPAPDVLRQASELSGGRWYENVGAQDISRVYREILHLTQGDGACEIEWLGGVECVLDRDVVVSTQGSLFDATAYSAPADFFPTLKVVPSEIDFGLMTVGAVAERTVTITSPDTTATITDIAISNPEFELLFDRTKLPIVLRRGEELTLGVRFRARSVDFRTARIELESDACALSGGDLYAGFRGPLDGRLNLLLTDPNGGEVFPVGGEATLTWWGVRPEDTVVLDYSTNAGATWAPVARQATGLSHKWIVPNTPSKTCLARVTWWRDEDPLFKLNHGQGLIDAFFDAGGRRVVTIDNGGAILIWDVNGGTMLDAYGQRRPTDKVAFSRDRRYVALAGRPGRDVHVWSTSSKDSMWTFADGYRGDSAIDGPLCLSPDGSRLITRTPSTPATISKASVWDRETGVELGSLFLPDHTIACATFSVDGGRVATGGTNGEIVIWDLAEFNPIDTLIGLPGVTYLDLVYTADANLLVAIERSAAGDSLSVWDARSGMRKKALAQQTGMVDLDATGLFAAVDHGRILELRGDALVHTFGGHTAPIASTRFSPDRSFAVTAGLDGYAMIWNAWPRKVAMHDISDSLWAIVAPALDAVDVDFGTVTVGESRDLVVDAFVTNPGEIPVDVSGITFAGANPESFGIVSGAPPFTLLPGTSHRMELRFEPLRTGPLWGEVALIAGGLRTTSRLTGVGVAPRLRIAGLDGDAIDFGRVPVNASKDASAVIENLSAVDIVIDRRSLLGPDLTQFTILSPVAPFIIPAGGTARIDVRFAPLQVGIAVSRIGLASDADSLSAYVGLIGEGIAPNDPDLDAPGVLAFGASYCASQPDTLSVVVSNPGGSDLMLTDAAIAGTHALDFSLVPSFVPITIPSRSSATLNVRFVPGGDGLREADLVLGSNAPARPSHVIRLSGTLARPQLALEPATIDLGRLCPGEARDTTVTITNVGNASTHVCASVAGGLRLIGAPCIDLPVGASVSVPISFIGDGDTGARRGVGLFIDTLCGWSADLTVDARVEIPAVRIVADTAAICAGDSVQLSATGAVRYEWFLGDGLDCLDCADPVARPTAGSFYAVRGYDADGCVAVDSIFIPVRDSATMLAASIGREHHGSWDDTLVIPLELSDAVPADRTIDDLRLSLRYDAAMMRVDPESIERRLAGTLLEGWMVEVEKDEPGLLTVRLVAPAGKRLTGKGSLLLFDTQLYLAGMRGTDVAFTLEGSDNCLDFEEHPGYVRLDTICGLNFRLIELESTKYGLQPVMPNPTSGRAVIGFSLGLDGPVEIEVYDATGNRVGTVVREAYLRAGGYEVEWNTEGYGAGLYRIGIVSGDWSASRPVIVRR